MTARTIQSRRVAGFTASIFGEMSLLAQRHQAINLGQSLPDFPGLDLIKDAASAAIAANLNQYPPPHNPTGMVLTCAELELLAALCTARAGEHQQDDDDPDRRRRGAEDQRQQFVKHSGHQVVHLYQRGAPGGRRGRAIRGEGVQGMAERTGRQHRRQRYQCPK